MRRLLMLLPVVLVLGATTGAALARQKYTTYGHGTRSCGDWLSDRKKQDWEALVKEAWVTGFVSGVGYASSTALKQTDTEGLLSFIDRHCTDHPLDLLVEATTKLTTELRGNR